MKVLFIGGTGIISSACTQHAVEKGIDVHVLNRGKSSRPIPDGARLLKGDIRDLNSSKNILRNQYFDVVVDWVAYTPEHIDNDIELFRGKTGQYIFISSASAYQTPPNKLPVTENTPLSNPFWKYSQDKIACENRLLQAYYNFNFPVTIVRPSHTYDKTTLPFEGRYTIVARMRQGKKVIVHGDGTSIWVLTHHKDFAKGFTGLLGNTRAIGETFHITSDELLTWNQIFDLAAEAAITEAQKVHIPSEVIAKFNPEWGASLLGDKSHSMIFDNTKIKSFVPEFEASIPFKQGAKEILQWYDADPSRQMINHALDRQMDEMISYYGDVMNLKLS